MKTPRVFIGTLYCGEGDFFNSCTSILSQKNVNIQHTIISNLPEKEAHNRLWKAWRAVQNTDFDFFVKIDADTVLEHDEVLLEFWKMMETNPQITGIQAPLHDYFTNSYINGLNCFSPKVIFQDTNDPLFCDRKVDINHDVRIGSNYVSEKLRPAGKHCFFANKYQSFHYGLHRYLKNQFEIISKVKKNWDLERINQGDKFDYTDNRSFALLGAITAKNYSGRNFDYNSSDFNEAFNEAFINRKTLLK